MTHVAVVTSSKGILLKLVEVEVTGSFKFMSRRSACLNLRLNHGLRVSCIRPLVAIALHTALHVPPYVDEEVLLKSPQPAAVSKETSTGSESRQYDRVPPILRPALNDSRLLNGPKKKRGFVFALLSLSSLFSDYKKIREKKRFRSTVLA